MFYLDDGTLDGSVEDVLSDFRLVEEVAAELGLSLNQSKTELICDDLASCEAFLYEVPDLQVVSCSEASLLGSPIGSVECVDSVIQQKVAQFQLMGDRLSLLHAHDALLLLRHYPKTVVFAPHFSMLSSKHLEAFDVSLHHLLCKIINVNLDDESAWLQATLPVRLGGIGIRRAVQLAPSAYLAPAAGCSSLITLLLPSVHPDPHIESACNIWSQDHSHPLPSTPEFHLQKCWDAPRLEATYNALLEYAPNQQASAHLLAVQ